ncbi:MAG TPA: PH domain-containing protein [Natronosporangium sp.]
MVDEPPDRHRGEEPDPPDHSDDDTAVIGRAHVPEPTDDPDAPPPLPEFDPEERRELEELGEAGAPAAVRRVMPLEDKESQLIARYLFPTERFRGEWRRHPIHLAAPITVGIVATFVLGWLAGLLAQWEAGGNYPTAILVLLWLGVMGWVGWRVADWHFDRFVLTNKRIMKVDGLITRNVAMMPLLRVTDMKYVQSPLGRLLKYGTFVIESAGQDQALREVPHLPNPNELYLRVVEEMYEPAAVEARLGHESSESDEEERVGDS